MLNEALKSLSAPGAELRGAPFWAWNSKLDPEELRRQIRIFKQMGMGGFFMHSRVGMATPYLGKKWFECIDACRDEAEKQGMYAWLYDEDRWPSGAAGGLVTKDHKYRQRFLHCVWGKCAADIETRVAALAAPHQIGQYYSAKVDDSNPQVLDGEDFKALPSLPKKAPQGRMLVAFFEAEMAPSSWYNGQTYLDTMNPDAVGKFIAETHEKYKRECGQEFGKAIPGIFTDEPSYGNVMGIRDQRPWTSCLPVKFKERYGYDLVEHLPELFFNIPGNDFSTARYDYYRLCTDLFTAAFAQQIGEWCEKNHLEFTGHALYEDDMITQRAAIGDAMRFYEFQQLPGIDLLTEHSDHIDTAKQCSSVAHQLDRPNRLCEVYGCTGWDFGFAGHKALGDWLQVLGINFRVQHLAWYSMRGEAKRDYPASISFQSSWWPHYSEVEDYFARQRAILDPAKEVRDILVINPIESMWGYRPNPSDKEHQDYCNRHQVDLRNMLLGNHLDFDYGCEDMLPRYSSVTAPLPEEELWDKGPRFQVGVARYSTVILPPMETIRATTLELLEKFAAAGGAVYFLDDAPAHLDGRENAEVARRYRKAFHKTTLKGLLKALQKGNCRIEISTDRKGDQEGRAIFCQVRQAGDYQALFLVNTAMEHPRDWHDCDRAVNREISYDDVSLLWNGVGKARHLYKVDQMTGKITLVGQAEKSASKKSEVSFFLDGFSLSPLESMLFIATEKPIAQAEKKVSGVDEGESDVFDLGHCFEYALSEPNAMVLDHAAYSVIAPDGRRIDHKEVQYILKVDRDLRDILGVEHRGGSMCQPWLTSEVKRPAKTLDLTLDYTFDCEALPQEDLQLVIENPELYAITLNGVSIDNTPVGEWFDPLLQCLKVPASVLRIGINRLTLKSVYHAALPGLEAIFLRGNFGVRGMRTMTALPDHLHVGDWCSQGLPNYSGDVVYRCSFKLMKKGLKHQFAIEMGQWRGACLGVKVNDGEMKLLPWPPYRCPLEGLKAGLNTIEITVFGSRRNVCGPFYCEPTWPNWTGSGQFCCYDVPERRLVPSGLLDVPLIVVK